MSAHRLTPAERLFVELCRRHPRLDVVTETAVASGPRAFAAVSALAMRHAVHGLVLSRWSALRRDGVDLPGREDEIDEALTILRRQATFRDLEQDRVLAALARGGHQPLVLKGGALRRGLFSPVERTMGDLDILVDLDDVDSVLEALGALGYRSEYGERARSEFRTHHQHDRVAHPRGFVVEVHWQLTRPGDPIHLDAAAFQARAVTVDAGVGPALRVPSAEDTFLHTVSQSGQDGMRGLRRLVDLDRLAATPDLDWTYVRDGAHASGLYGFLCVTVRLAGLLLGTRAPDDLLEGRDLSPHQRDVIGAFRPVRRLLDAPGRGAVADQHLFRLWCARPDHRDRLLRNRVSGLGDSLHWVWAGEDDPAEAGSERASGPAFGLKLMALQAILYGRLFAARVRRGGEPVPDFWTLPS